MIEQTYDLNKVQPIVMSMFNDVAEDGTDISCADFDLDKNIWLSCDDFKGVFQVQAYNRTMLDIHCYIIKEHRNKSFEFGIESLRWVKNNAPKMYTKVITQVPSLYPHVKKYVESLGFELEGTYKNAFTKHGKVWDFWLFGINRGDIK